MKVIDQFKNKKVLVWVWLSLVSLVARLLDKLGVITLLIEAA